MAIAVLIPLKPPSEAKERLSVLLNPGERRELAVATLLTVVGAVTAAGLPLAVITPDTAVAADLLPPGDVVIAESAAARGLSAQIEHALTHPFFAPFDHVVILHADLPLAASSAVKGLAARADSGLIMVRSADGGTNALLSPLPLRFALQYGRGSFEKHQAAARAAGLAVAAFENQALALDLDTPDDLRSLMALPGGSASPAGRLLLEWGVPARLAETGAS